MLKKNITRVYKWYIETEIGAFTGTSLSIDDVNKEITLLTNNAKVLKKNMIPMSFINKNQEGKVYTWSVITNKGQASGLSNSLKEAKRIVNSFIATEVITSNIA
jgi:hypothetical protein